MQHLEAMTSSLAVNILIAAVRSHVFVVDLDYSTHDESDLLSVRGISAVGEFIHSGLDGCAHHASQFELGDDRHLALC